LKGLSLVLWNGVIRSGKCFANDQGEDACGQNCSDLLHFQFAEYRWLEE